MEQSQVMRARSRKGRELHEDKRSWEGKSPTSSRGERLGAKRG